MGAHHYIAHIEAYRRRPRVVEQFDPILLAAGIEAPALSAKMLGQMRARAAVYIAGQVAKSRPRSAAQKLHAQQRGTVGAKIVRDEVRSILTRLRWLGAIRVGGVK